jgi:hypothetical protein
MIFSDWAFTKCAYTISKTRARRGGGLSYIYVTDCAIGGWSRTSWTFIGVTFFTYKCARVYFIVTCFTGTRRKALSEMRFKTGSTLRWRRRITGLTLSIRALRTVWFSSHFVIIVFARACRRIILSVSSLTRNTILVLILTNFTTNMTNLTIQKPEFTVTWFTKTRRSRITIFCSFHTLQTIIDISHTSVALRPTRYAYRWTFVEESFWAFAFYFLFSKKFKITFF